MISFDFEFIYSHLYEYALRMRGMLALLRAWYKCFQCLLKCCDDELSDGYVEIEEDRDRW